MKTSYAPNRAARPHARKELAKFAKVASRQDTPEALPLSEIKEADSVLQPRFDSIAYAPGRSEAHITELARVAKSGTELDPVAVAAFGDRWFLIDGHHRMAAYREAGWTKPVPVKVLQSELSGDARVEWAVEQSFADNKKNRLNMSNGDKMDGAWLAVAHDSEMSIADTARAFGVSERTVANMRKVKAELVAAGGHPRRAQSWRMAQSELKHLAGDQEARSSDFRDRQRREAAKRLKAVMDMQLAPGELAEALDAYSPGIVEAMAVARADAEDDGDSEDFDVTVSD